MAFDVLSFIIGQQTSKSGGGSGDYSDVHFVTFMSEDGSTELYKRPVADGDDCADPVKRGYIDEPTKESTVQYNYTLVGWSATPNGALDSNILKAVKADKTVYANFAAVVRYYTVTYLDDDGVTVLKTESLAYGTMPSYIPTKDGYNFVEWTPKEAVRGDMSYTAVWKAKATFETATWAEIAAICEAGNAKSTFAIGEEKPFTITYADGTTEENAFVIAGFDTSPIANNTKTVASITLVTKYALVEKRSIGTKNAIYKDTALRTWLNNDLFNALPADLQSVVKDYISRSSITSPSHEKCWIPSIENINLGNEDGYSGGDKSSLELFSNNATRVKTLGKNGAATSWLTRSAQREGSYYYFKYVDTDGTLYGGKAFYSDEHGIVFFICI